MYKITDEILHNLNVIEITEGDLAGVKFIMGEIKFDEHEEGLLHYEYTIAPNSKPVDDMEKFKEVSSTILVDLLEHALAKNEVIYKGGKTARDAKD